MDEQKLNAETEDNGLTFKDLLFIIKKHLIAILVSIAAFTVAGFVITKVQTPVYQSSGTMLVSYEGTSTSISTDYTFSNYISNTYVVFITQDVVLDKVAERQGVSTSELKSNTKVSNSSLILTVSYTASDPLVAQEIAQTILDVAQEVADSTEVVDGETKPVYHLLNDNLKVLSPAKKGSKISHTTRNTLLGALVGLVIAFLYVLLRELFDNTFKSTEEIERVLNIPVLAGIPEYEFAEETAEQKEGK